MGKLADSAGSYAIGMSSAKEKILTVRWPWLALLLLAVLRLIWLNAYPHNSDEAQHAHVAWAWTRGLLLYRDVFDNHGPLFSWVHSWALRAIGERADVVTWLRLCMQAWYALALYAVWRMGRRLYTPNIAFYAMFIAALVPRFFLVSGQFRTDDMWMALWLAALAVVVAAPPRGWRWFVAGMLAGAALSVSQKTLVLLCLAGFAGVIVAWARRSPRPKARWRFVACGVAGLLLVPGVFGVWLAWRGDLGPAWYALVAYNTGGAQKAYALPKLAVFLVLSALGIWLACRHIRRMGREAFDWPVFLVLQAGLFLLLVWFVWPLITAQDFLPAIPPLVLVLSGAIARLPWLRESAVRRRALGKIVIGAELIALVMTMPPWVDRLARQRAELGMVLRYTDPADTVMDAKGDAIFRRRPYFPVIESMAMIRLREGSMADTIAEQLVRHRTMFVLRRRLPAAGDAFVESNYLPAGDEVWIAGLSLPAVQGARAVDVALPGDYVLTDGKALVAASVDGAAVGKQWDLGVGRHRIDSGTDRKLYLVWRQAWERGFRPSSFAPGQAEAGNRACL
jgi:hypothetical protein